MFFLALAALALLGMVSPDAWAQAPTPTFKITGLIDQLITYSSNASNYENNFNNRDTQLYGRTRGRFDFVGEVGKAKGVLGIEIDATYGQTGAGDNNIQTAGAQVCFGCTCGFDLNTDVRTIVEVKWLYTEFPLPLVPFPTTARIGAQPMGSLATYKLSTLAGGDFAGASLVSNITPNVKVNLVYGQVEEGLTSPEGGIATAQWRGDDMYFVVSTEVTPMKGLDIRPVYAIFYAENDTSGSARQARGGMNTGAAFNSAHVAPNVHEYRHTIGLDARWRWGAFSLDPTVMYQFGTRTAFNPFGAIQGFAPGQRVKAEIDAWLLDIRAGFQIGPVLIEGLYVFSTGNKAQDTTLNKVRYYQPINTDTGYLADWGTQLTSLGLDYFSAMNESGSIVAYPGVAVGWDKYGRQQLGLKATYAFTPTLSATGGVSVHWTHRAVDPNSTLSSGLLPSFTTEGDSNYVGTELHLSGSWKFAPGLSWDNAFGIMFPGKAMDAMTPVNRDAKEVYILTSRVRFTF
jgi:hypothetical protein